MTPDQSAGMDIEGEFQYIFPTYNHQATGMWGGSLVKIGERPYGGGATVAPFPFEAPWAGDQFVVRGAHVQDCGHGDSMAAFEIHPPKAMIWAHENGAHDWNISFNAATHSYRPQA